MNIIMSRALQHQYPQRFPPTSSPSSPLDFTDRIPFNELQLSSETLGSGSFGTVYKGHWRGRHVAVKHFKTREEIDSFLVEVKQLSCVKHQNIVTLYGASTHSDTAYLVMEYAEGGSLNSLLHECKQQQYDLRHACSWAMQTARGVAYLHEIRPKPIMHRDLKPANLLLFSRGKILKICDFGTACAVKTQMTNNTGSASYMAPEVFATSSYLESGDVFSWSIIFWEILARRHPYEHQYSNPFQILWCVKQQGARPSELESCPKIIWNLISRSWNKDPKKRPSMRQVANDMEFIFSLTDRSATSTATNSSRVHENSYINSQPSQRVPNSSHLVNDLDIRPRPSRNCMNKISQAVINVLHPTTKSPQNFPRSELYYHSQALSHSLVKLRERAQQLERVVQEGKGATKEDSFLEFEELKKRTAHLREELKRRQQDSPQSG